MALSFVLTDFIIQAMKNAVYDKLEDGTFGGRIPVCKGVVAFGTTQHECETQLRPTLEDWILIGLKFGHVFPIIGEVNLNLELRRG